MLEEGDEFLRGGWLRFARHDSDVMRSFCGVVPDPSPAHRSGKGGAEHDVHSLHRARLQCLPSSAAAGEEV